MSGVWDELAAGDEVEDVESVLRHMSGQLEELGGGEAAQPLGHIVVPRDAAGLALPSGEAQIDFSEGVITHESITGPVAEFRDLTDVSRIYNEDNPSLKNLILISDTVANMKIGGEDQRIFFQQVPIPQRGFSRATIELTRPGELSVLASTRELPISLASITLNGQRFGRRPQGAGTETVDAFQVVEVQPHALFRDHSDTHAEAAFYVAPFDSVTITIENTTGAARSIDAQVQAAEELPSLGTSSWREIASDTGIADGDHTIFTISERHKWLRIRYRNNTNGEAVSCEVEVNFANP